MSKNMFGSSRGFTLIELLVVIAIIGILSGIVLVNLRSSQEKARDAKRLGDIRALVDALNIYYSDNKVFPTTLSSLAPSYVVAVPLDPRSASGSPIAYSYAALGSGTNCNGYHVGATLETPTNDVFQTDSDTAGGAVCDGSAADFDGTDPVYDLKY